MTRKELVKFKDLFGLCNTFYRVIGVPSLLQDGEQSPLGRLFYWISFWNVVLSLAGEYIFVYHTFGKFGSFLQLTALAPCMCFVTIAVNTMIVVKTRRHRILQVIATLEHQFPKSLEEQRGADIQKKKRQFERFLRIFSTAFTVLIVVFNFIPFTEALIGYVKTGVWHKELPYFIWYPFDQFDDKYFPYIYFHQTFAGFTTVFAIVAEEFLIGSCAFQICIQFEMICSVIRGFEPYRKCPSENHSFVRRVIIQHNRIIETAEEFADIISGTLFIHHVCSSLVICFVGFQVMFGENFSIVFKFLLFLIYSLVHTITINYFGNEIIENSSKIASAVYESDWLQSDFKYRRDLLLIMIRARRPQTLKGLKYTTVSLRGFTKILSTSYSYFALIRKIYKRL